MATEVTLVLRFEDDLTEEDVQALNVRAEEEFDCIVIDTETEDC